MECLPHWGAKLMGGDGDGDGCLHTGNGAHVSLIGAALAAPSMPLNFFKICSKSIQVPNEI